MGNGIGRSSLCCSSLRWLLVPGNGNISERQTKKQQWRLQSPFQISVFSWEFYQPHSCTNFSSITMLDCIFPCHTKKGFLTRQQHKNFQITNFSAVLTRQVIPNVQTNHSERILNTSPICCTGLCFSTRTTMTSVLKLEEKSFFESTSALKWELEWQRII